MRKKLVLRRQLGDSTNVDIPPHTTYTPTSSLTSYAVRVPSSPTDGFATVDYAEHADYAHRQVWRPNVSHHLNKNLRLPVTSV